MSRREEWWKFQCVSEMVTASMVRAVAMEAASTSATSLNCYQATRRAITQDSHLQVLNMLAIFPFKKRVWPVILSAFQKDERCVFFEVGAKLVNTI
jgi:hypothetical protein